MGRVGRVDLSKVFGVEWVAVTWSGVSGVGWS